MIRAHRSRGWKKPVATIRFLAQVRGRWDRLGGRTLIESVSVLVDKATVEAIGDIHSKEE
jgi:hypothetical protein